MPFPPDPNHPPASAVDLRQGPDARRRHDRRFLQHARRHARHDHGVLRHRARSAFAAFGNYVMPLQIGTIDMAFPRLNMGSVILFFISAVLMFGSFVVPGGAAKSGWTSYTPLAIDLGSAAALPSDSAAIWVDAHGLSRVFTRGRCALTGQSMWIIAMAFNITSSLLCSRQFHHHHRAAPRARAWAGCACRSSSGPSSSPRSCCCSRFLRWRPPRSCS